MSTQNIEKEIVSQELEQKNKYVRPLKKVLKLKIDKIIETTLKMAKKEKIEIEIYDVESLIENFWVILSDDIYYVPGFADEYTSFLADKFYKEDKISINKISKYLLDKHIG